MDEKIWLSFLLVGIPTVSMPDFETPFFISPNFLAKENKRSKNPQSVCCNFVVVYSMQSDVLSKNPGTTCAEINEKQ
jgi:hypothetical protein